MSQSGMIMKVMSVIPPELRPLVSISMVGFVLSITSVLNDLYQKGSYALRN